MKRILTIALMLVGGAGFAAAQITTPTTDVLGAHLNYGRGCAACHAPHSGALGNGIATGDTTTGQLALWGEDVKPLYGLVLATGQSEHGTYSATLPSTTDANDPATAGLLMCLSCHDGNYTSAAMMKDTVYETLPATYGATKPPTLLDGPKQGSQGAATGYLNDHPVGENAAFECNSATYSYGWNCSVAVSGGKVTITPGPEMTQFKANYGFFVSLKASKDGTQAVVMCTTCHNQHLMNVVNVNAKNSGQTPGNYATMFFIRAPYNPASTTTGSNQTAQFCRQCHGGEANEMNNGTAVTTF